MNNLKIRASALDNYNSCNRMGVANSYPDLLRKAGYTVNKSSRFVKTSIGTGVHSGAEHLHKHILEVKTPITDSIIEAACEAAFNGYKRDILYNMERGEEVRYTVKFPNHDAAREYMNECVKIYAKQVLPQRRIDAYEQQFDITLGDGFTAGGKFDSYGDGTLYDLKTGEIKTHHAQIGFYTFLLRNAGYAVKSAQLDFIKRPKDNLPIEHKAIVYDPDECMVLAKYTIVKLMKDLQAFQETGDINVILYNPRSSDCNQWCPLFQTATCSGWKQTKS